MKWIFRLFGFLLVLILTAVGALFLIPTERIAAIAADQIRTATGREVKISGDVSMTLWPVLGVKAGEIEVGNADWAKEGPMLTAENAAIGVDAAALLGGEIKIKNIEANAPTIRLEQRLDGRASWEFTDASGTAQIATETDPDRAPQAFSIERLAITDATLIYDAEGSDLVSYSGVSLTLDWPERLGPATVDATLVPAGQTVKVDATIGQFADFITGKVQPVNAVIQAAGGRLALNGRASTAGDVAGALDLAIPDTDGFLKALALPGAALPPKLGQSITGSAAITLTGDRQLALRDVRMDLGGNALSGAADISLNGTPQINAQFNAGALDLTGLTGDGTTAAPTEPTPSSGWPTDPIDASGLSAFNGEIALNADSIDLGRFKLGTTRTRLTNDNSRMVFALREIAAYNGMITGEFVLNNRNGLSVGGKMDANGIGLEPILKDALGTDRLTGAAEASVRFLGVGQSVDAIMKSLSGEGAFDVGQGTIKGIDLDKLMRGGQATGGTTIFDSLRASFTMDQGNLFNEDLVFSLLSYQASGKGRIGLGAQDIDYNFTPISLKSDDGSGIAIPVRIRGPWSGPSILPDLEAAIDLKIEEVKDEVEERAKDALKAKVQEELGVTVETQDELEDALKNKAEQELRRGLRSLFD